MTHCMTQKRTVQALYYIALVLFLAACGGGADTSSNPNTSNVVSSNYSGPAPGSDDVQRFKLNVWDNLVDQNRCGSCHGAGGQSPTFVQSDDINAAYVQANTIVNLATPSESRMVVKVAGGHNCWETSDAACADTITRYIEAWSEVSTGATSKIILTAPIIKAPGESKSFPADSTDFGSTLHGLLVANCSGCHTDTAANSQSPYFANSNVDSAYAEAKSKINLDAPEKSRFVLRLKNEFHNCWTNDCQNDADVMEAAIIAYTAMISPTVVDEELVASMALSLTDGILANSGGRYEENIVALYEFKAGDGDTAFDTSGVEPALNLTLSGNVEWVGGWGIKVNDGKAQGSTDSSRKLHEKITSTGEYSIEAWVVPGNVTQEGPAGIVSYSAGTNARNFTLGQTLYNYDFLNRSSTTNANGEAALSTDDDAEILQASLQHVVATYSPSDGRKLYVNGEYTGDVDQVAGGNLNDWDDTFAFVLGNEVSGNRLWQGTLKFVAIHNRALSLDQIKQNFEVNVGQKFYLLFSNSHITGLPESYVVFQVSQYDNYSYLFSEPFFISLDPMVTPDNIEVKGMRLGINGREVAVGQAFSNIDINLSGDQYNSDEGQSLSNLGTIIPLEKGADADEFFLTFEVFGDESNVVIEAEPAAPAEPTGGDLVPDIGLKLFDEINASMSAITGVSRVELEIKTIYEKIKQQLPSEDNIQGFLSSHQMAVTQLAIGYCNELVDDTRLVDGMTLRENFFGSFQFDEPVATAFDVAGRDLMIDALNDRILGVNVDTQPSNADVKAELNNLIDKLVACGDSCSSDRTLIVVKASCAAVLGSAAVLVQ